MNQPPPNPSSTSQYGAASASSPPLSNGPPPAEQHLAELLDFAKDTQDHLSRLQADFLSESTRKEQRLLLVVSFLLLFVSLGSITIGKEVKIPLGALAFTEHAPDNLKLLGALVCAYLEVTLAIRIFTDRAADSIFRELASLALAAKAPTFSGRPIPFNGTDRGVEYRIDRGWYDKEGGMPPEVEKVYETEKAEYEKKLVSYQTKRDWLDRRMRQVAMSTRLRIAFDVLFPLTFGAVAIYMAYAKSAWGAGG